LQSFSKNNAPKTDGQDIYMTTITSLQKDIKVIENIALFNYDSSNLYKTDNLSTFLKYPSDYVGYKNFQMSNCLKNYFKLTFYNTAGFSGTPFFKRNVNSLSISSYCNIFLLLKMLIRPFSL
jgi:hypothetical protein